MAITSLFGKTFSFKNLLTRSRRSNDYKAVINQYLKKNPVAANKKPFCHTLWQDVDFRGCKRRSQTVEYHSRLNGINHHLITGANPKGLHQEFMGLGVTPHEIIQITDAQFKTLPKTTEKIIAYRCIGEKPEFFKIDYAKYQKSLKVKKGDIVIMPEYAYSTSDINYAKVYLPNEKGIMYEIEYPIGSRISVAGHGKNNEIVAPRCSQYECLGSRKEGDVTIINLKYIQPMDYIG